MNNPIFQDENSKNPLKISINRWKVALFLLGAMVFVGIGAMMFFAQPTPKHPEWKLKSVGIVGVLFFGLGVVVFIVQFFSKGLIISENGIEDDISLTSFGLIKWHDISKITMGKTANQHFVIISIKEKSKNHYLEKCKNPLKKWFIKQNLKRFGYTIPVNLLKIKSDDLIKILKEKHHFYKNIEK